MCRSLSDKLELYVGLPSVAVPRVKSSVASAIKIDRNCELCTTPAKFCSCCKSTLEAAVSTESIVWIVVVSAFAHVLGA